MLALRGLRGFAGLAVGAVGLVATALAYESCDGFGERPFVWAGAADSCTGL
jgi:hypothetical protein